MSGTKPVTVDRHKPDTEPPTAWRWPEVPLSNRYGVCVTEVLDGLSDGHRVAVIEGPVMPPVGTELTVREDDAWVRRGPVTKVEIVLGFRGPARILVWADLERVPAG